MDNNPVIDFRNIDFSYGEERKVFNDFNFQYRSNTRIALIGHNGSGKSTLLQLCVGLLKAQDGELEIFGRIRKTEKDFEDVRRRLGLLFQNSDDQLFCPTVQEDIAFGPYNLGKSEEEIREIVQNTCRLLGLEGYENRVSYKLSAGEKRLVALATVIAMKPEVLLLDEPTAGLDENATQRLVKYLNTAESFMLITHDIHHLKDLQIDRIYKLEDSRIIPWESKLLFVSK